MVHGIVRWLSCYQEWQLPCSTGINMIGNRVVWSLYALVGQPLAYV